MLPDPDPALAALTLSAKQRAARDLLHQVLVTRIVGRPAVVSSFGAESAVLLDMVAQVDPTTPVLFIDTLMLFEETLHYFGDLSAALGLTNVQRLQPNPEDARRKDVFGRLHKSDPDRCCQLRKVAPLSRGLSGYTAWISGRKRHQNQQRAEMTVFERDADGRIKINPLADWSRADLIRYAEQRRLPAHPLESSGFTSIGCAPCTQPPQAGQDGRSGRWAGLAKTECGIHFGNRAIRSGT